MYTVGFVSLCTVLLLFVVLFMYCSSVVLRFPTGNFFEDMLLLLLLHGQTIGEDILFF